MFEELVAYVLNVDCDENWDDLEDMLFDEYNIGFEEFQKLLNKLLPMCMQAESPLTGKMFCGFADKSKGMWLLKVEVND